MIGGRGISLARGTGVGLLVLEPLVILLLWWQFLDVYLSFFGDTREAGPGDGRRYVVTASICLACPLVAGAAAVLVRSRRLLWWSVAGLVLAVMAGVLFAVPDDRFARDEPTYPINPEYTPCYSGSNDCPGG
jgi:hypothetical protein